MPKRPSCPAIPAVLATVILLAPLVLGASCRSSAPEPSGQIPGQSPGEAGTDAWAEAPEAGLTVLASFSILADMVRQVAGLRVRVDSLLPLETDPHLFQPTAKDLLRVQAADLIVLNGAGLEAGLEELLTGRPGAFQVVLTEGVTLIEAGEADHAADQDGHGAETDRDHGSLDPHAWLDPRLAMAYVEAIASALSAADPAGAGGYAERSAAYQARLAALDAEIEALLAPIAEERRLLVTDHEALGYFAKRYRLRVVGSIVPGLSSGAEPSARSLADLVDRLRASGAPAVFLGAGADRRLADQLAGEAGVRVVADLYLESLSGPEGPASSYLNLMRHNAAVIAAALAPAPTAP